MFKLKYRYPSEKVIGNCKLQLYAFAKNENARLFIIGSIGALNFGDDAMLVAFLRWLDDVLNQTYTITIYSKSNYVLNNLVFLKRIKVRLVNGCAALKAFLLSNFVIICGGDYLDDYGSFLIRFRELSLMLSIALLSKMAFKKLLLINNGVRANSLLGLAFEKLILVLVDKISVRDDMSLKLVSNYKSTEKGFDTAILLQEFFSRREYGASSFDFEDKKIDIALSISPIFKNFFRDQECDMQLSQEIAKSVKTLLDQNTRIRVFFLAFNTSCESGDQYLIKNIIDMLGINFIDRVQVIAYNGEVYDFIKYFSRLDFIVCYKYHSIVLSYLFKKPMIVINCHPKNVAFAREIRLTRKALLSLKDIYKGELINRIFEGLQNPEHFKGKLPISDAKRRAIKGIMHCISDLFDKSSEHPAF